MNREYLKYLNKSKTNLNVFLIVINLIFPTLVYFATRDNFGFSGDVFVFAALIMVFIEMLALPVYHFNYINSKARSDRYYSLPISRKEIFLTTLVYIWFEILISHFISILPILFLEFDYLFSSPIYMLKFVCFDIISIITTTSLVSAIFMKAYTTFDGIAIILGYLFSPLIIYFAYVVLLDNTAYALDIPFNFLNYFFYPAMYISLISTTFDYGGPGIVNQSSATLILTILLVISLWSIIKDTKTRKAEYAGTISNNFFSYPLVIALASIGIIFLIIFAEIPNEVKFILMCCMLILYLVMNFVYRRRIQFKVKDLILFAVAIAIAISINVVAHKTDGFGLGQIYQSLDNPNGVYYSININDYSQKVYHDSDGSYSTNEPDSIFFRVETDGKEKLNDTLTSTTKALQDRFLNAYHKCRDIDIEEYNYDRYATMEFNYNLVVNYGNFYYRYPDYSLPYRIRDMVEEEIYDINDPNIVDKILTDVYTMIEEGCVLSGEYHAIEQGEDVIYEISNADELKLYLERFFE